jgi:hypothetical protein
MPQDLVRVNPESIERYGSTAQQRFDTIRQELVRLVDDGVQVDYFGPNAVNFKTKCGEMASDFGTQFSKALGAIADAVRTQTSNISQALGGRPISIAVNGSPIPLPPVPQGDGSVQMKTSGLTALVTLVNSHISAINDSLDTHMSDLQGTDWTGQAKDTAVDAVRGYTGQAKNQASEAQQAISKYINDQIQAVQRADQ